MKKSNDSPRVVLVGVGRWGANHLRVWQSLGADLFVAEPAESQREAVLKSGVKDDHLVRDCTEVLDRVDLVDIVTPVDSHYRLARTAVEAGKDVFIEKPMTSTSAEGVELVRRADELGRIVQVGHIFRYDPATDFIRDALDRGVLGKLQWLHGKFAGFKRPRADCGVTAADALHFIDLFNFLVGRAPAAVMGCLADFLGRGMDDMCWMALDYKGVIATVEANYFAPAKDRGVTIVGDTATLVCDYAAKKDRIQIFQNRHLAKDGTWKAVEGEVTHHEVVADEPLTRELGAFVQSSLTREAPLAGGHCGYEVVQIIEAAQQSSETGQTISLDQRSTHAKDSPVEGLHLRRDQAESAASHRQRAIHSRPELHRV